MPGKTDCGISEPCLPVGGETGGTVFFPVELVFVFSDVTSLRACGDVAYFASGHRGPARFNECVFLRAEEKMTCWEEELAKEVFL
mmetsp:Transcript_31922/g.85429  ORF Transcript_31922/g.85429 Transcript_31922/m.85429 type:complete len:85 (-) Transcript_31922:148-402(-)